MMITFTLVYVYNPLHGASSSYNVYVSFVKFPRYLQTYSSPTEHRNQILTDGDRSGHFPATKISKLEMTPSNRQYFETNDDMTFTQTD